MNKFLSISFLIHLTGFLILASFLYQDKILKTTESILVGLVEYKAEDTNQNNKKISKERIKVVKKVKVTEKKYKKISAEKRYFLSNEQKKNIPVLKNTVKSTELENNFISNVISTNETSQINPGKAFEVASPNYRINPKPRYPLIARKRGHEGEVLLSVWVLEDGSVGELKLEKPSGYSALDESALNAVRKWLFFPGRKNGIPIRSWVTIPIKFQLTSG